MGDFVDQPMEKIASMLAVNMAAPAELCRLYGADMAAAGRGALLLTSSLTAFAPLPGSALYGASRAFIHSLAGGLAEELAPRGVKVRCVLPGSTDTGFSGTGSTEQSLAVTGPTFSADENHYSGGVGRRRRHQRRPRRAARRTR